MGKLLSAAISYIANDNIGDCLPFRNFGIEVNGPIVTVWSGIIIMMPAGSSKTNEGLYPQVNLNLRRTKAKFDTFLDLEPWADEDNRLQ